MTGNSSFYLPNAVPPSTQVMNMTTGGVMGFYELTGTAGSVVMSISPTITTPNITTSATITNNALVATTAPGLTLQNTTAATTGSRVQVSPAFIQTGQGWATTGSLSKSHNWRQYVVPVSSTTGRSYLDIGYDLAGGGYNTKMALHSNGGLTLGGSAYSSIPGYKLTVTSDLANTAFFSGDGAFVVTDSSAVIGGALIYATGNKALGEGIVSFGDVFGTYGQPQFYLDTVAANFYDGNLNIATDSKALTVGAGADGEFYHDGTDTWIRNNTGLLKIDTGSTAGIMIATTTAQKVGFFGKAPVVQQSALTTQLTTITHTEPGTPDYALQDMTNVAPYGFVTQDEANSLLKVVKNLQTRFAELETKQSTYGFLP